MRKKILPTIILLLILFVIFFDIYIKFFNEEKQITNETAKAYETTCGIYKQGEVQIGDKNISVDIADDDCKRDFGLSGKISMGEDTGMIFTFKKTGNYGFWMKDMNFPLDILWIGDDFKVVGIEKDISTSTYPESFGEKYFARYVLEISAKYCDKNNIKVGNKIIFSEK